jgi:murein DD-endopeptidase MepM/ murein hydrolase activator NlpD
VSARPQTYTVKQGDSLGKIAKANQMSVDQMLKLNPELKSNPDLIKAGQKLFLCCSERGSSECYSLAATPCAGLRYAHPPGCWLNGF